MTSGVSRRLGAALGAACLLSTSCTALREIPRPEYTAAAERKDVRVETRDDLVYEFDFVRIAGDTLTGFRRRDTEGPVEDYAAVTVPLDQVARLSARGTDWKRTGMIGAGVVGALVVAGLSTGKLGGGSGGSTSGGGPKGGGVPTPP